MRIALTVETPDNIRSKGWLSKDFTETMMQFVSGFVRYRVVVEYSRIFGWIVMIQVLLLFYVQENIKLSSSFIYPISINRFPTSDVYYKDMSRLSNHQSRTVHHMSTTETTSKDGIESLSSSSPVYDIGNILMTQKDDSSFESFDYLSHWYPVIWVQDLPLNRPMKVTIFDVDYVVARTLDIDVMAMTDACPHKKAALSEGRVTKGGMFQCAYHGWTFNGTTGHCVSIPQIQSISDTATSNSASSKSNDPKSCGTAIPALIQQGMVWLFPGGNLEKALSVPPPPSVPEIDMPGFTTTKLIRDFPIDWSILLENILDPDHGLFAHQAKAFDLYSASKDLPISLSESFPNNGKSWTITSSVKAVDKLLTYDKKRRVLSSASDAKKQIEKQTAMLDGIDVKQQKAIESAKISSTTFYAPNVVTMARRRPEDGTTNFVSAFFVCPVGTGRSRFMSCTVGKIPIRIPRWVIHIGVNNFLDEDTYLLATQQTKILKYEAECVEWQNMELRKKLLLPHPTGVGKVGNGNGEDDIEIKIHSAHQRMSTDVRKSQYVYRSPSEKLGIRLGKFFDATLHRVPNRITTLRQLYQQGAFLSTPSRRYVLDREWQHLQICPDSQNLVKKCNAVIQWSRIIPAIAIVIKLLSIPSFSSWPWNHFFIRRMLLRRIFRMIPQPNWVVVGTIIVTSIVASILASKMKREYYFKFDESYRDKKVDGIPSIWLEEKF